MSGFTVVLDRIDDESMAQPWQAINAGDYGVLHFIPLLTAFPNSRSIHV